MSDINISIPSGENKRFLTGGKYCPDDIVVTTDNLEEELSVQDRLISQIMSVLSSKGISHAIVHEEDELEVSSDGV